MESAVAWPGGRSAGDERGIGGRGPLRRQLDGQRIAFGRDGCGQQEPERINGVVRLRERSIADQEPILVRAGDEGRQGGGPDRRDERPVDREVIARNGLAQHRAQRLRKGEGRALLIRRGKRDQRQGRRSIDRRLGDAQRCTDHAGRGPHHGRRLEDQIRSSRDRRRNGEHDAGVRRRRDARGRGERGAHRCPGGRDESLRGNRFHGKGDRRKLGDGGRRGAGRRINLDREAEASGDAGDAVNGGAMGPLAAAGTGTLIAGPTRLETGASGEGRRGSQKQEHGAFHGHENVQLARTTKPSVPAMGLSRTMGFDVSNARSARMNANRWTATVGAGLRSQGDDRLLVAKSWLPLTACGMGVMLPACC